MRNYKLFFLVSVTVTVISCTKNTLAPKPKDIRGNWLLTEAYANNYWGGPLHWQTAKNDQQIHFTSDYSYYRKYPNDTSFTLVGTYSVLSDSTIQVAQAHPVNPSYPNYILYYSLERGGYLILGIFASEGVVMEKYKKQN